MEFGGLKKDRYIEWYIFRTDHHCVMMNFYLGGRRSHMVHTTCGNWQNFLLLILN